MKGIVALIVALMVVPSTANAQFFKHKSKTVATYPSQPMIAVVMPPGAPPPVEVYIVPNTQSYTPVITTPSCTTVNPTVVPYTTPRIKMKRKLKMKGC